MTDAMNRFFRIALLLPCLSISVAAAQAIDTQVDVGGNRLNFHIVKGNGMPILFEAGGGDDSTMWRDILPPLARITGATLITYDRPGFGKSELDAKRHGIVNNIIDLEQGLETLGYDGDIMLVGHSLGGSYVRLYAARHPERVKAGVLIDVPHVCFFTPQQVDAMLGEYKSQMEGFKVSRPGLYYLLSDYRTIVDVMRKTEFPASIPFTAIVAENPPFKSAAEVQRWKDCHQEFVQASSSRKGIVAATGHFVFQDNPALVINAIVEAYADTLTADQKSSLLERSLSYNIDAANQLKKQQSERIYSENDINAWGYQLLQQEKKQEALEVFKLNVKLYPKSANTYDSLAEGYEGIGDKKQAIVNYQHSLELDASNSHANERLRILRASR